MARLAVVTFLVLAVEWGRALLEHATGPVPAIALGGLALGLCALGWKPEALGLSRSNLGLKLLATVLLLRRPCADRDPRRRAAGRCQAPPSGRRSEGERAGGSSAPSYLIAS